MTCSDNSKHNGGVDLCAVLTLNQLEESMTTLRENAQPRGPSRSDSATRSAVHDPRRDHIPGTAAPGAYPQPAAEVKEIVRLAVKHRCDVHALARATQVARPALPDLCLEITRHNASLGLENLWRSTDDVLVGSVGIGVPRGALRPLTFTVCGAPNLTTAVRRYQEFHAALPGLPAVTLEVAGGTARLSFDLGAFDTSSLVVGSLGLLVAAHRVITWATRRPLILHRVELPHARPVGHRGYQMMFGATPLFDAASAALVFDADALTRSFVRGQDDIERFLEDAPANLIAECDFYASVSAQVRRIIEGRLGKSSCTSDQIAAGIAMSRPTLWRRLRDENTSISQIRDQVLRDAAVASLARGDETVAQLSRRLGFSEPSAFSRAFRRWTGRSPRNYQAP